MTRRVELCKPVRFQETTRNSMLFYVTIFFILSTMIGTTDCCFHSHQDSRLSLVPSQVLMNRKMMDTWQSKQRQPIGHRLVPSQVPAVAGHANDETDSRFLFSNVAPLQTTTQPWRNRRRFPSATPRHRKQPTTTTTTRTSQKYRRRWRTKRARRPYDLNDMQVASQAEMNDKESGTVMLSHNTTKGLSDVNSPRKIYGNQQLQQHLSNSNQKGSKGYRRRRSNKTLMEESMTTPSTERPKVDDSGNSLLRQKQPSRSVPNCNRAIQRIPNVYWGAIPMDHLRQHPCFVPLPLPIQIRQLHCVEDVRNFRQSSWQWAELHRGRCTTSHLASVLGFSNPKAGDFLEISWAMRGSRGSMRAYYQLLERPLRTLDEMNRVLCSEWKQDDRNDIKIGNEAIWRVSTVTSDDSFPFYACHQRNVSLSMETIGLLEQLRANGSLNRPKVATMWGNAQEATAILTAINYFTKRYPGVVLKEVGMCGAGSNWNSAHSESEEQGLLIGASPDALLHYPDGRIEVVEVKNHCPFFVRRNRGLFTLRCMPLIDETCRSVPVYYIPQLMMEMLCVGPQCTSAVMVRQTALNGAIILRLHRNDDWIGEMLYWSNRFFSDFVVKRVSPTPNFFWDDASNHESERYKKFLQWTKDLSTSVDVVCRIPNNLVQRASADHESIFL